MNVEIILFKPTSHFHNIESYCCHNDVIGTILRYVITYTASVVPRKLVSTRYVHLLLNDFLKLKDLGPEVGFDY